MPGEGEYCYLVGVTNSCLKYYILSDYFGTSAFVSSKNMETDKNTQRNGQQAKVDKNEKENGHTINTFEPQIKMCLLPGLV